MVLTLKGEFWAHTTKTWPEFRCIRKLAGQSERPSIPRVRALITFEQSNPPLKADKVWHRYNVRLLFRRRNRDSFRTCRRLFVTHSDSTVFLFLVVVVFVDCGRVKPSRREPDCCFSYQLVSPRIYTCSPAYSGVAPLWVWSRIRDKPRIHFIFCFFLSFFLKPKSSFRVFFLSGCTATQRK